MTTLTIQPAQSNDSIEYDVNFPLPYPFLVNVETGVTKYAGEVFGVLIGMTDSPDPRNPGDLNWLNEIADDPDLIPGRFLLFSESDDPDQWFSYKRQMAHGSVVSR